MIPGMVSFQCNLLFIIRESPYSLPIVTLSPETIPEYTAVSVLKTAIPTAATINVTKAVIAPYSILCLVFINILFSNFFGLFYSAFSLLRSKFH